jgi:hypothetical protein
LLITREDLTIEDKKLDLQNFPNHSTTKQFVQPKESENSDGQRDLSTNVTEQESDI